MKKKNLGFTLVELVIVIAIVIVLSVVSVPIYRNYVDKAKMTEGYALLATCLSAQKAYFSEHGNFLRHEHSSKFTNFDTVLGVDARGNKYFTWFRVGDSAGDPKIFFDSAMSLPKDLANNGKSIMQINYNITSGATIVEKANW